MKTHHTNSILPWLKTLGAGSVLLAMINTAQAGTTTWGGAGGNENWSTPGNWTTVGGSTPPGTADTAFFRVTGASGTAGTINNIVDVSRTIGALTYTNETSATFHTTQISTGNTLTVNGPIFVGGTNNSTSYTITGGGTLIGGSGSSGLTVVNEGSGTVTLDMSSLTNFIFNTTGNFNLGLDAGFNSGGACKLAFTSNNITANTMVLGQNNNGGTAVFLSLGAGTNILNVNTLEVGWDKLGGTLQFFTNTGSLYLRNAAGTGGGNVDMGDQVHTGNGSASATGSIYLKGHYVDMLINTLTLANRHARTGGTTSSFFSFDSGVVNVTNINMDINQTGTTIGTSPIASLAVGGGTMNVVNNISLANIGGTNGTSSFIITNGGLVTCGGTITRVTTTGTASLTISGGTLKMTTTTGVIGSSGVPISNLNLTNATLHLALDGNNSSTPQIVATAVNTNGVNTIAVDSLINVSSTVTIPLISYTGTDPFGSLALSLPAGYTGNLVDNTGSSLVELTVNPPSTASLVWAGITNGVIVSTWDTNKTKDWVDAATLGISQVYMDPDTVLFSDSGATGSVTLPGTVEPLSITFSNNLLNYTVSGPGQISGTTSLTNLNGGTVVLKDNGDNFSGAIVDSSGTLILDETNSALTGPLSIANGAIAQIGQNDTNGALPAGGVDVEGSLIFSRANNLTVSGITGGGSLTQNGSGVLTLIGGNTYSGSTTVAQGKLALGVLDTIANSSGLLVSNATLDVSAVSGTTTLNDFSITNAVIKVAYPGPFPSLPLSANTMEVDGIVGQSNIINVASFPIISSYPVTFKVIQSANAINLAGGNFNFALGTLPPASPAYVGSLSESSDNTTVLLTLTAGPTGQRPFVIWADANDANVTTNWSDRNNWLIPGAPLAMDSVIFDSSTTVSAATETNNIVDTSFTVATLAYNQTNSQYHVTQIPAGNVLTVNDNLTVGGLTQDSAVAHVAFVDAGTLVVNGSSSGNLVGNSGSSSSSANASLDLSGLGNFIFNSSSSTFGVGNIGSRGIGTLLLAAVSNNITASQVALETSSASSSVNSSVTLGAGTNIINAATFNLGASRSGCTLEFPAGSTSAGLRMRGVSGADTDRMTLTAGNRSAGGSSGTANGIMLLNSNRVDMKLSTLTLGECDQVSPVTGNGVLQFDTGVVDATTVNLAVNTTTGNAYGTNMVGTNAVLIVGSGGMSLVNNQSTGTAGGGLVIEGGTVICSNSITKTTTAGTAVISLSDGTLNMVSGTIGSLAMPIDELDLNDNGTLDTRIQLNVNVGVTNIVATTIVTNGTTTLNINSILGLVGTVQVPLIKYSGTDPFGNLKLGTVPAGYTSASLVDNTANGSIDLLITSPSPIVWVGAVGSTLNSAWSAGSPANWLNGVSPVAYADGEFVQFDDTSSNSAVTLPANVSPGGIGVTNNVLNYTISGTGGIGGNTGIAKQGSASLVLDNSGANTFAGSVQIYGGTLQIGKNDTNGLLPAGTIVDNGTLAYDRSDNLTVSSAINGTGGLSQIDTNLLTIASANAYSGATAIAAGTLRVNNTNALGSWSGGAVTVASGGTLDIGGLSTAIPQGNPAFGAKQFNIAGTGVGGEGAIVNNGPNAQLSAFQSIMLTADSTIGGQNRWDIRNGTPTLNLNGFTLTKISTNQDSFVSTAVSSTGNIIIDQGILSFETASTVNGSGTLTVNTGGSLGHFRLNSGALTMPITLNGGAITNLATTGTGSINDAPITLTANSILGGSTTTNTVTLNGAISSTSAFGLTKAGVGPFILTANNTYTGNTVISSGSLAVSGSISDSAVISINTNASLDVSGRSDTTLTLNSGQTLGGFGVVTGIVNSVAGSTVSPGSAIGTGILTATGNVTLNGTTVVKLNAATSTNDVLSSGGVITYGGVLQVSNLGGALAGTSTFKLFNAAPGNYAGFFSSIVPAIPAPGLAWNTNTLTTDGTLRFTVTANLNPTNIVTTLNGSTLTLTWPMDHAGWTLQSQTNSLAHGLGTNWVNVAGSSVTNSVNIQMDPTKGTVFFRMVH